MVQYCPAPSPSDRRADNVPIVVHDYTQTRNRDLHVIQPLLILFINHSSNVRAPFELQAVCCTFSSRMQHLSSTQNPQTQTASTPNGQSSPAGNEAESPQGCDRPHGPVLLRVNSQEVQTSTEHGHAGNEQATGPFRNPCLRRQ
jgi:hypothetical protein